MSFARALFCVSSISERNISLISAERLVLFLSDLNDSHLFCHSVGTSNAFERNEQFSVDNNCFNLTHYPQEDQSVPLSPTSKLLKRFKQTEN